MLEFEKSKYTAVHDLADGVATPPHAKPQRCLSMCQAGCDVHGSLVQRYPVCGGSEQNSHCVYPAYRFKGSLISTGNFEQNSTASKYQKKEVELGSQSWMACLVARWMACLVASWMACLVASWMTCLVARWMACLVARCSSKVALLDTGFVPLFHTAVERASCRVHKVLHTGGVPTSLTLIVLAVADGLFGLNGSHSTGTCYS